jgi:hypothetical protein
MLDVGLSTHTYLSEFGISHLWGFFFKIYIFLILSELNLEVRNALHRNVLLKVISMLLSQNKFPRFMGENLEKNKILYSKLANKAEKHACATPQLALSWLLHQGDDIIPIPGIIDLFLNISVLF